MHLGRQSFDYFLPRYRKTRRQARKFDTVLAPLFPGYIFVRFDKEQTNWRSINGTFGVRRLICSESGVLRSMPARAVESLLAGPRPASPGPDRTLYDQWVAVDSPLFAGIDNVRFKRQVKPGDTLRLEVEIGPVRRGIGTGSGTATVDGELACRGDIMFALVPKPEGL